MKQYLFANLVLKFKKYFIIFYLKIICIPVFKVFHHNHLLELFWTLVPTLIILLLLSPSLSVLCYLETLLALNEPFITVRVLGNQWFWNYSFVMEFKDFNSFDSYMLLERDLKFSGIRLLETDNPLFVPVNYPLRFLITSVDVLHSWAVPSLGVKIDACPGRINQFFSLVVRSGDFYGQCSEICGVNHGFMPINVVGVFI